MRQPWGNDEGISATRGLIESTIRSRLLQNPKITLRPASLVTGLTSEGTTVTGVFVSLC